MRSCYYDRESNSIADLIHPGELTPYWTITRISVPSAYRKQGIGTRLLQEILTDADAEGLTLMLEPSPSDGMEYLPLIAWYRKHGFSMTKIGYMKRKSL